MPLLMFYVVMVGEVGQEQVHVVVDMDIEWQPQPMMMTTSPMMI